LIPRYGAAFNPALIARTVLPLAWRLHAQAPFDLVDAQLFHPVDRIESRRRIAAQFGFGLPAGVHGSC
jgi:hypothetical protein